MKYIKLIVIIMVATSSYLLLKKVSLDAAQRDDTLNMTSQQRILLQQPLNSQEAVLGERPKTVQQAIDDNFQQLQENLGWQYEGESADYYLMNIENEKLILHILRKPRNNIYLMDVGAGEGEWARSIMSLIKDNEEFKKSNKRVHIISVTGQKEFPESITRDGNITLYEFPQFKIENIESELKKKGLFLENNIDLIVSHKALQHLVDPVGTIKQLYGLLNSPDGMLLSSGFALNINGEFIDNSCYALWSQYSYMLFMRREGHFYDFLVIKKEGQSFAPALEYTGEVMDSSEYRIDSFSKRKATFKCPSDLRISIEDSFSKDRDLSKKWIKDSYVFYRQREDPTKIENILSQDWAAAMTRYAY